MGCELDFDGRRSGFVARSKWEEPRWELVPRSGLKLEPELESALHSKLALRSLVVFRLKTSLKIWQDNWVPRTCQQSHGREGKWDVYQVSISH